MGYARFYSLLFYFTFVPSTRLKALIAVNSKTRHIRAGIKCVYLNIFQELRSLLYSNSSTFLLLRGFPTSITLPSLSKRSTCIIWDSGKKGFLFLNTPFLSIRIVLSKVGAKNFSFTSSERFLVSIIIAKDMDGSYFRHSFRIYSHS